MRCNIHGVHMEITPALRDYVESKLGRLEKFDLAAAEECRVTLRVTKKHHIAEVTIPTAGAIFRAEESSDDMYKSIDMVIDKLNRQIRKYKERMGLRHRVLQAVPPAAMEDEMADAVVRIKRFEYKPMGVDEAILQMDLLGHNFFVFANAENNQVSVVYKRHDGGYGLIEPAFR